MNSAAIFEAKLKAAMKAKCRNYTIKRTPIFLHKTALFEQE
jgi:hypothetical protein